MKFVTTTLVLLGSTLPVAMGAAPPPCKTGPFQITSFRWFNSTNNLNCPDVSDPKLCFTGRPAQPPGYGPPDYVSFTVKNVGSGRSASCRYQNPGAIPAKGEPGKAGLTKCSIGDQSFIFTFTAGPSNGQGGSATAQLSVTDRQQRCV